MKTGVIRDAGAIVASLSIFATGLGGAAYAGPADDPANWRRIPQSADPLNLVRK